MYILDSVLNNDSIGKNQNLHRWKLKKLTRIFKNVVCNYE